MEGSMSESAKVVIKQAVLRGAPDHALQRVAIVYISGQEYRVYAPSEAKGEALEWADHFKVRHSDNGSEMGVPRDYEGRVLRLAIEELTKTKHESYRKEGKHPDGLHCTAQICLKRGTFSIAMDSGTTQRHFAASAVPNALTSALTAKH
jgi:hypothetical protein